MNRNIGIRFVLTDPDNPDFCHPVGRVHSLTVDDLRRMVEVFDHIGEIPEGYEIEIQAVRRKLQPVF
jgi:hypothetical protein